MPTRPKLTEADVTRQVIPWLRAKGWTCIRLQSGLVDLPGGRKMRVGTKGLPDWICVQKHTAFFLELKSPKRTPSIDQDIWMELARERGHVVMWADSFESFQEKFRAL